MTRLRCAIVCLSALGLASCQRGPSDEELQEERYGPAKITTGTIKTKEKTANGNYYFVSTEGKYCKLGVYGPLAPLSDFDRMSRGDRYECIWNWEKRDFR